MTDAEWLTCSDPRAMLGFLKGKVSDRKLRLFACACCRRIWHLMTDARSRGAIEMAERYANGQASDSDLRRAALDAWDVHMTADDAEYHAATAAYYSVNNPASPDADDVADAVVAATVCDPNDPELEDEAQVILLRDIFGNPFRPVEINPSAITPAVVALSQTIYNDRVFERMPELGEALEGAGCTNTEVIGHCRGLGPHVRGCWALDLVWGRE